MDVRHVALFCSEHLLGESLAHLLNRISEIELIGPWLIDEHAMENLASQVPDIVLIAEGEHQSKQAAILATQILDTYSEMSVIRIALTQTVAHIYSSRAMPARSADLVEAIRGLPIHTARNQAASKQSDGNELER
jgi:hypothetical protein